MEFPVLTFGTVIPAVLRPESSQWKIPFRHEPAAIGFRVEGLGKPGCINAKSLAISIFYV